MPVAWGSRPPRSGPNKKAHLKVGIFIWLGRWLVIQTLGDEDDAKLRREIEMHEILDSVHANLSFVFDVKTPLIGSFLAALVK